MSASSAAATTTSAPDPDLVARLKRHGQEHLLAWWAELTAAEQSALAHEIAEIDFEQLDDLITYLVHDADANPEVVVAPPNPQLIWSGSGTDLLQASVQAIDVHKIPQTDGERSERRHAAEAGHKALRNGEVAVVVVAGGQGTRLGFDGPKGTFPIGPVSTASLFQIHAEKVLALSRRYERDLPLYVMTSQENHEETQAFFADNGNFGLKHVRFFPQGRMPVVDRTTGKILMESKGRLALSPNGHGGTLTALAAPGPNGESSCLEDMEERGIKTIYYFQVDNPLVQIADPAFLGLHRQADAQMSFKVVEKLRPEEKLGVVVAIDGVPQVIEYSDLPAPLAERRGADNALDLWAGSIAIHLLELSFIEKLLEIPVHLAKQAPEKTGKPRHHGGLPFHRAWKKVAYTDPTGALVEPREPNAVKFEMFIFDALPFAERFCMVETQRTQEFEPLKNATGGESPASVRQRMSDLYADWLESAGAAVPRRPDGSAAFGVEISPLYALDHHELKAKLPPNLQIDGPVYFRDNPQFPIQTPDRL